MTDTNRPVCPELEKILFKEIPLLDHGFVRVIDYMGDDSAIVQAARVSYGKGTKQVSQDRGLIRYLLRHNHNTPFEMCEIKFHIKLPIFVARQWIRHRTANVNEYSARYSILSKEFYIPSTENLSVQSKANKQGRENTQLTREEADEVMNLLQSDATHCYNSYKKMLNEDEEGNIIDENKPCIARELARMNLTLNYYTEWYWKIDLSNLLKFIQLRADPHAQYEIRVYAKAILDIVKQWLPLVYEAFVEYKLNSHNFSSSALKVIRKMIKGAKPNIESSGISKREWEDMMKALDLQE